MYAPVYVGAYMHIVRMYTINIYHTCVHKLSSIQCVGSISAVVYAYIYNEFVYVL